MATIAPTAAGSSGPPQMTPPPPPPPATAVGRRPPPGPPPGERTRTGSLRRQGWLRRRVEAVVPEWGREARRFHEFADLVALERDPEAVETALVSFAGEIADACRVELLLDRDDERADPDPRRIALWPESSRGMSANEVEALGYPLCLGLWCGDHFQMTLQVYERPGRRGRWPSKVVRRLTTLCAMSSATLRGLHAGRRARPEAPVEMSAAVRDATFLYAILPYALSQAQRHREPLTVFCVEIDRLRVLAQSQGLDSIDRAVRRVAEAVAKTLRGSDVVARLADDRVMVVLPNTGPADARTVAEVVRSALVAACLPIGTMPALTASVGIACFPDDAPDSASLLSAADDAMTRARAQGPHCVQSYSDPIPASPPRE